MSLISLIVILIVFGILLWVFNTHVTAIDPKVKSLINVVVVVVLILFVLYAFGIWDDVRSVKVPRV